MATATPAKKKPAAKKPQVKKAAAKKTAAKKPTARKGRAKAAAPAARHSKALDNRMDWTDAQIRSLVKSIDAAPRGGAIPIYKQVAKERGNGVKWESVRAMYYQHRDRAKGLAPVGVSRGARRRKGVASLPADPVKRVQALVKRRAMLEASIKDAQAELADIDKRLAAVA